MTLLLIRLSQPLALRVGLVDHPCSRKRHASPTPLTGGIAIFFALLLTVLLWHGLDGYSAAYLGAGGILVLFGALDDRSHIKVGYRVLVEIIAASIMIFGAGIWVGTLGNLLGAGEIHMPFPVAYLFTLVAVFGIVNATNMLDGMDGLAGGVTLAALCVLLAFTSASAGLALIGLPLAGGLAAFLIANTGCTRLLPKVFLGDAGSKLLGLSLVWVIIETARAASNTLETVQPATALYLVALPLMDTVDTTINRVRRGGSPFHPDRTHLHHVLADRGWSQRRVVLSIILLALGLNLAGVLLTRLQVAEALQLGLFFALFLALVGFKAWSRRTVATPVNSYRPIA